MLRNEKGLTLIETLAAVAILGIVVVAFSQISSYVMLSGKKSDTNTEALRIAERSLNQIRADITNHIQSDKDTDPKTNPYTIQFLWEDPKSPGRSLPPETVNSTTYNVYLQQNVIETTNNSYNRTHFGSRYISMQSIVLLKNTTTNTFEPRLLTVTVSWEA